MEELLMKIATHYTFLFTEHNFKFTNSEFVKGVSCIIEINNNLLKIGFLSNQRDGFDLLISSIQDEEPDWWSLYYICKYLNPIDSFDYIYSREVANCLKNNFEKIVLLFNKENYKKTKEALSHTAPAGIVNFIN